ncbi:ATP-binding protein [Candidatus Parabeggiatoa sp. HSG14]|uniref:ATP-binding response regulator n=1 Tax=Candidatus Parabeggiatoa sp. HSG14 TaxID=3055593 RepID=UPI0025A8E03A|nr:ATP-binding protein [Thiotrichales bacterium HSG14]
MNQYDEIFQDEENLFAPAEENTKDKLSKDTWEILIVDDEADIHQMTRLVLVDFTYENKSLNILSAYSAEEAKQLLVQHNIALIFLDVVMESNDAGLKLVAYIRETLKNHFVRIILRTGQPGHAPEKDVICKYEINDYSSKTELTAQKTFTIVTANLRAYSDIMTIESYRQHLEQTIAERTCELHEKNGQLIQLNQELRKKNGQLTQLNQDKSEFLGIVAHDMKNSLSAIQGLSQLIESDYDKLPKESVLDMTKLISTNSKQMFDLIKNLLDVNAIEAGKMNFSMIVIDILPIIQILATRYHNRAKSKNITVLYQSSNEEHKVLVDETIIYQVLDNLTSNAVKYSSHNKNIIIHLNKDDKYVRCEIEDEGPGLSDVDQQKLFGKFTRLTPQPTGDEHSTGLGLFIVKKLVEAMHGKVWCKSKLGDGSRFIVEFPNAGKK